MLADEFDDFDFGDEIVDQPSHRINTRALTPDQVEFCVSVLTDEDFGVNIIPILKVPLYIKTHPLHQRNVLDLPLFNIFLTFPTDCNVFRLDAFYNQTTRSNFTAGSTNIRDYIALEDENLIRALQDAEKKIREQTGTEFDLNVPIILSLFSCMTIEERRAGFMFQWMLNEDCFQAIAKLPLFYVEHNFSLTDEEICAITNQGIPGISTGAGTNTQKELNKHLVRDRITFGDLRLDLGYAISNENTRQSFLGLELTFPTHFALKKGLLGEKHKRKPCDPNFDLCEIITLSLSGTEDQEIATDKTTAFFIGALDQLTANVLDPEPYNDGRHITIGLYSSSCIQLCDWLTIRSKSTISFVTPHHEERYYIPLRDPKKFNRDYDDNTQAAANMAFLNKEFNDKFYPKVIRTNVWPGIILQMTTSVQANWWNCGIEFGTDLWWQSEEHIECNNCMLGLDIKKGIEPEAFQSKIFGKLTYQKETKSHLWNMFLGIDGTTMSSGIGKDFSVILGFEVDF